MNRLVSINFLHWNKKNLFEKENFEQKFNDFYKSIFF